MTPALLLFGCAGWLVVGYRVGFYRGVRAPRTLGEAMDRDEARRHSLTVVHEHRFTATDGCTIEFRGAGGPGQVGKDKPS
jgi:hypothetical protein